MNSLFKGLILRITHTICLKFWIHADDSNKQVMEEEMFDQVDNTRESSVRFVLAWC